jgi:hypothetical protein
MTAWVVNGQSGLSGVPISEPQNPPYSAKSWMVEKLGARHGHKKGLHVMQAYDFHEGKCGGPSGT